VEHGASRLLYLIAFVRIRVLLFLGAVFPDIALVRLSGYGSHIAFIAQMAALFASSLHPHGFAIPTRRVLLFSRSPDRGFSVL
jgi:hypothetical protein